MEKITLNVSVDESDKKKFESFCHNAGMDVSTAINIFIKAVLREQKIPFEIKASTTDDEVNDTSSFAKENAANNMSELDNLRKEIEDKMNDLTKEVPKKSAYETSPQDLSIKNLHKYFPDFSTNYSKNIQDDDYIIISSSASIPESNFNMCLVDLNDSKVYEYEHDMDGHDVYNFYKDLNPIQKEKLMNYINDNDLLNFTYNNILADDNDTLTISIGGHNNTIKNASKKSSENEVHLFDDIVNIVFDDAVSSFKELDDFFNFDFKEQ